jgi:hypothetical protein
MRIVPLALTAFMLLAGCASGPATAPSEPDAADAPAVEPDRPDDEPPTDDAAAAEPVPVEPEPPTDPDPPADDTASPASPRPDWLGTIELPLRPDGLGEVGETPPELRDRRFAPPDDQPRADGDAFVADIAPVPDEVAARSTWRPDCPVGLDELRYVTVTFWGFDERPYVGELLVHAAAADDLVEVFRALHEARFPIEEMRVVGLEELDAPPTGDGNNTTGFVCRSVVSGSSWSQHAYGLAVDINPFHNPYVRGDRVVPELASAYLDRDDHRPGMIQPGDVVTEAFDAIGWGWGGDWRTVSDWMHFSATGR